VIVAGPAIKAISAEATNDRIIYIILPIDAVSEIRADNIFNTDKHVVTAVAIRCDMRGFIVKKHSDARCSVAIADRVTIGDGIAFITADDQIVARAAAQNIVACIAINDIIACAR
jgi:hypothetical protein